MKAVTLGDDGVEIKELPNPEPTNEQVLVKVKSCGLNRSDLLETQGQSFGHTGGDTKIIGGEFAGEIVELGEGVEDLKVGDKVMCRGGSGWAEYKKQGTICGIQLKDGLVESEKLENPIFTPSTKAEQGEHDENIDFETCAGIIGEELANKVKEFSIQLYSTAHDYAKQKGIIIADTKFEFGLIDDELILIDEVLTPDSSRFWPLALYGEGRGQQSYDKQFVRDYLTSVGWDKKPPAPELPSDIAALTSEKYIEAIDLITS